jgi:hypothetical protein
MSAPKMVDLFLICEIVEFLGCRIISASCDGSGAMFERDDWPEPLIVANDEEKGGVIMIEGGTRRDYVILRSLAEESNYQLIEV